MSSLLSTKTILATFYSLSTLITPRHFHLYCLYVPCIVLATCENAVDYRLKLPSNIRTLSQVTLAVY